MTFNLTVEQLNALQELDLPEYDDVSNAPAQDGTFVYVTGDGATTPEGAYLRAGGTYDQVGSGLLTGAGASAGDILTVWSTSTGGTRSGSTTNTSYENGFGEMAFTLQWDEIVPSGVTGYMFYAVRLNPGSSSTTFSRIYNNADGEATGTEISSASTGLFSSGWIQYTPTTTASPIRFVMQYRTDNGANSDQIQDPAVGIGWQL